MTIDLKTLAAAVAHCEKDLATYPMEGFPTEKAQIRALITAGRAYMRWLWPVRIGAVALVVLVAMVLS